jgi:hypothetical protein
VRLERLVEIQSRQAWHVEAGKPHRADDDEFTAQLNVQRELLEQIKVCEEILNFDPNALAVLEWKNRLEFLLTSRGQVEFDGLVRSLLRDSSLRGTIDFDLPTDSDQQLLVGTTFAEASSNPDVDDEKKGIVACMTNIAYYATYADGAKTCYNSSFGDGTVLAAIKKGSAAYGSPQWKRVMEGDALQSKAVLERTLIPSEIKKLKACVQSVTIVIGVSAPTADPKSNRNLLQFNRADDSPPNPNRQEKVARYAGHTFYAFKLGRECQ